MIILYSMTHTYIVVWTICLKHVFHTRLNIYKGKDFKGGQIFKELFTCFIQLLKTDQTSDLFPIFLFFQIVCHFIVMDF